MSKRQPGRGRPGTVCIAKATQAYTRTAGQRPYDGPAAAEWDKGLMKACPRIRQVVQEGVCVISIAGQVVPRGQGRR